MLRPCPHCGKSNRVPAARLADTGRCGACSKPLPAIAAPLAVDVDQFREIVAGATVPVLVDFWAQWCGPCRTAAPEVERVARDAHGHGIVLKVDTESHPELANEFGVRGIPSFIVFNRGAIVLQHAGVVSAAQMMGWLERAAA